MTADRKSLKELVEFYTRWFRAEERASKPAEPSPAHPSSVGNFVSAMERTAEGYKPTGVFVQEARPRSDSTETPPIKRS